MSPSLHARESSSRAIAPFPPNDSDGTHDSYVGDSASASEAIRFTPPVLAVLVREFRALARQRGLPLPSSGAEFYEHVAESDRGRKCLRVGRFCTFLGCTVGAGITAMTVNVGAYALPVSLISGAILYGFSRAVGSGLQIALNAYPHNPESLVPLRHLSAAAATTAAVSLGAVMYLRLADDPGVLGWLSAALLAFELSLLLTGSVLDTMAAVDLWSTSLIERFASAAARVETGERKREYEEEIRHKS